MKPGKRTVRLWTGLLICLLSGCLHQEVVLLQPLPTATRPVPGQIGEHFRVYFSRPEDPASRAYRGGPDEQLVRALDQALFQVDMAVYDLNLWSVRDALIRAHRRGVQVRLVADQDHLDGKEFQQLLDAGIPIRADTGEGLMHHKFVILDGSEVWTGSMNLTVNGAYRNDNHLLRVRSRRLAENYTAEFEEMFDHGFFGPDVLENTPYPVLDLDGIRVETYFSPDDRAEAAVLNALGSARERIDFLAFAFTSDPIGRELRESASRGVRVRGVFDSSQLGSGWGSEYGGLLKAGIPVCRDSRVEKMHHKVMVIDGRIVICGSYNFSRSAEEINDENLLIIDDPGLAAEFVGEFERLYSACR